MPTGADTYSVYYQAKATALDSYYDNIDLPDNNFYILSDFMLYKASLKLGKTDAKNYFDSFMLGINNMKVISNKQNSSLDSFGVGEYSNV